MDLDGRKVTILKAIIKTYLETGEPVGSRTISKYSDLKLSSATIRNEMSDLEEMGYILQPHTSAGRIPSDKGYRFYVDQLMEEKDQEMNQVQELMIQRVDRLELVLKRLVQMLASNTNYAAMISGPQYRQSKLKFIQLSKMDEEKLLLVVVMEGNRIRNSVLPLHGLLREEDILNLNILLNSTLNGLSIDEINLGVISQMKEQAGNWFLNRLLRLSALMPRTFRYIPAVRQIFLNTRNSATGKRPASFSAHLNRKTGSRN